MTSSATAPRKTAVARSPSRSHRLRLPGLTRLVAVCDLKPDLLEAFARRWPGPALYQDWREMVERERPDVVAIVTSYGSIHGDLAAAVAETGLVKAIYCEKPIASSMAQADRIAAARARHHVAYSCAHVFRWNARYRQALAWIRDGAIGRGPLRLRQRHGHPPPLRHPPDRRPPRPGRRCRPRVGHGLRRRAPRPPPG